LVFDPTPELTAPAPVASGQVTQKVTAFADCAGALYVSVNTVLYRRNDGSLPAGAARWVPLYDEGPAASHNSGLRGLTCVGHDGSPSLLAATEGNGDVYRFDHLPAGALDGGVTPGPGTTSNGLSPVLEFEPVTALRQMLAAQGTAVPAAGRGAIGYVIDAYNNFESVRIGGLTRQLFGIEHAYLGGCPSTRVCGPSAFGTATFDAAACFALRTDRGPSPTYSLHCLGGPDFTLASMPGTPIRSGQAFVSIRTIEPSPFGDSRVYFGGYDCNFYPADGTAWIATATLEALGDQPKGVMS
jgi:hypothetical protein